MSFILCAEGKDEHELQKQEKKDRKELEELYLSMFSDRSSVSVTSPWRPISRRCVDDSEMKVQESSTLRITNLSDETTEGDLQEMVRDFGKVSRIRLV